MIVYISSKISITTNKRIKLWVKIVKEFKLKNMLIEDIAETTGLNIEEI